MWATTSSLDPNEINKWFLKTASCSFFAKPSVIFAGIDLAALLQFLTRSYSDFGALFKN